MKRYIIGLDEGTTSVRTVVYDVKDNKIVCIKRLKFKQFYPKEGYVEHDANEIYQKLLKTFDDATKEMNIKAKDIYSIGITTQRETVVAFDKRTGEPICNAIVWQCRRTSEMCKSLFKKYGKMIKRTTGLIIDSYFSATKMQWILDNVDKAKELNKEGNLYFGTMETFLVYRLSGLNDFITDVTNASRTMLMNIKTLQWDKKLLSLFNVDEACLAKIVDNCGNLSTAHTCVGNIPICSIIGDQQSSLFGQGCTNTGLAKNTYGTGSFMLVNTGDRLYKSKKLLNTVAYKIDDNIAYAIEGSVFCAGANLEWLRDGLEIIKDSKETSKMCQSVNDTNGLYFVPALTGLGSPHWDSYARGLFIGITRATTKNEFVRAVIESLAYSVQELIEEMRKSKIQIKELRIDGGVSNNEFLTQFQADLSKITLKKQDTIEATVLGAIYLAGIGAKVFKFEDICKRIKFTQEINPNNRDYTANYIRYKEAVSRSLKWDKEE